MIRIQLILYYNIYIVDVFGNYLTKMQVIFLAQPFPQVNYFFIDNICLHDYIAPSFHIGL